MYGMYRIMCVFSFICFSLQLNSYDDNLGKELIGLIKDQKFDDIKNNWSKYKDDVDFAKQFDPKVGTFLHYALWKKSDEIALFFIQFYKNNYPQLIDEKNNLGQTSLYLGVQAHGPKVLQALINAGTNIDAVTKKNDTAINHAASLGKFEAVKFLAQNNANPLIKNSYGSDLKEAVSFYINKNPKGYSEEQIEFINKYWDKKNEENILQKELRTFIILNKFDDIKKNWSKYEKSVDFTKQIDSYVGILLHQAMLQKNEDLALYFIEFYKDHYPDIINSKNEAKGQTPLYLAIEKHKGKVIKALLDAGADKDATTLTNDTAINYAALKGNFDALKVLANNNANPNIKNNNQLDMLANMYALLDTNSNAYSDDQYEFIKNYYNDWTQQEIEEKKNIFDEILEKKVLNAIKEEEVFQITKGWLSFGNKIDPKKQFGSEGTFLHYAMAGKNRKIAEFVLDKYVNDYKLDINIKDALGRTPLYRAVEQHGEDIIKELINAGAKVDEVTNDNDTAINHAGDVGNIAAIQVLANNNANPTIVNKQGKDLLGIVEEKFKKDIADDGNDYIKLVDTYVTEYTKKYPNQSSKTKTVISKKVMQEVLKEDIKSKEQEVVLPFESKFKAFGDLYEVLSNVTPNLDLGKNTNSLKAIISDKEFNQLLDAFYDTMTQQLKESNWSNEFQKIDDKKDFFAQNYENKMYHNYLPYMQKLIVTPATKIAFHGDLHGDIRSLMAFLKKLVDDGYLDNDLRIIKDDFYMLFLGDYTDRGWYGAEVIYTVFRLKVMNPGKVYLCRGNHEDISITGPYGFVDELETKYPDTSAELKKRIHRMYDFMPVVIYLGIPEHENKVNFLQCCHGGMEPGFKPHKFLASDSSYGLLPTRLKNDDFVNIFTKTEQMNMLNFIGRDADISTYSSGPYGNEPYLNIGFLWNDFFTDFKKDFGYEPNRGYKFGKYSTEKVLQFQSAQQTPIVGVFRAHQHNQLGDPMMDLIYDRDDQTPNHKGVAKLWIDENDEKFNTTALWPNIVCTFSVGPDNTRFNSKQNLTFNAFGILHTEKKFEKWKLEMYQLDFNKDILKRK